MKKVQKFQFFYFFSVLISEKRCLSQKNTASEDAVFYNL